MTQLLPGRDCTCMHAACCGQGHHLCAADHTLTQKHLPHHRHPVVRQQVQEAGEDRCSAAMQATVDSVELLAVVADGSPAGLQAALDHIVAVDPASAGVPLQQVLSCSLAPSSSQA